MKPFQKLNEKKKKGYSLAQLVAVLFAICVGLILFFAYFFIQLTFSLISTNQFDLPAQCVAALEREDYAAVEADFFQGKYPFTVLSGDGDVLYAGNGASGQGYTEEELAYIPEVGSYSYYEWDDVGEGDNVHYLLTRYEEEKQGDEYFLVLRDFAVFDADKNIIYSTSNLRKNALSKEFLKSILTDEEGQSPLQKMTFKTKNGQENVLVFQMARNAQGSYDIQRSWLILASLFTVIVVLVTILFGWAVSRSVRRPLRVLDEAMTAISDGDHYPELGDYVAPAEFSRAVDAFRQMSKQLSDSEAKRRRLEENRKKMLSDISHDLKTPVTVISGYASALSGGLIKEEDQAKYLDAIRQKSDLLTELVNSFYEYSRLEDPRFSLTLKEGDVCEYFRSYLARKYTELELSGYAMEIDLPEEPVMASFDEVQLKRVFENILSNTLKYNAKGTTVYAGLQVSEEKVAIRLGDDGVGIPDELKNHMFDPFVVGETARTSGKGTGLGLAIAAEIARAHHGEIRLMESDRYPVIFELKLPILKKS